MPPLTSPSGCDSCLRLTQKISEPKDESPSYTKSRMMNNSSTHWSPWALLPPPQLPAKGTHLSPTWISPPHTRLITGSNGVLSPRPRLAPHLARRSHGPLAQGSRKLLSHLHSPQALQLTILNPGGTGFPSSHQSPLLTVLPGACCLLVIVSTLHGASKTMRLFC